MHDRHHVGSRGAEVTAPCLRSYLRTCSAILLLMIGVGLLAYGIGGHSQPVDQPVSTADHAGEASAAESVADDVPEEFDPVTEGVTDAWGEVGLAMFGDLPAEVPAEDEPQVEAGQAESSSETADLETVHRDEFWLIRASTVGGFARGPGGQLLQRFAEGEEPDLCPS